ncbi:hypothetical protein AA671_07560 [Delftia tsuruhatensis]|nr:hypothetical protein AA671_07560 [Delftia tsuruhatensis]
MLPTCLFTIAFYEVLLLFLFKDWRATSGDGIQKIGVQPLNQAWDMDGQFFFDWNTWKYHAGNCIELS